MALIAGIFWSSSTTDIRAKSNLKPVDAAFVFAVGTTIAALLLAPFMEVTGPKLPVAGTVAELVVDMYPLASGQRQELTPETKPD